MTDRSDAPGRRRFLQAVAAGAVGGLAGCSGLLPGSDAGGSTPGDTPTPSETPRVSRTGTPATTTAADATTPPDPPDVENLRYRAPRDTLVEYGDIVYHRKRAALEVVLGVPEVADLVTDAVSSTAYHRILEGVDFLEILAPHEMTVTPSDDLAAGEPRGDPYAIARQYTIRYDDVRRVRALVDRRTDELLKLDVGRRDAHVIVHDSEAKPLDPARAALDDERVRSILEGKNWYVSFSGRSPYAAYSEDYPVGSLNIAGFNWNDREGDVIACHTIVAADNSRVLAAQAPTRPSPTMLTDIASEVRGQTTGEPRYGRGTVEPPGEFMLPTGTQSGSLSGAGWTATVEDWDLTEGTASGHGWEVEWRNTVHDGYAIEASYRGKPVLGPQTKIPYMKSDYEPFGMTAPGVPEGRRLTYMFWDPMGITGPGVVERHELRDGFRIRGTFHTGASNRWEWRFGQNFGPYRYIVDWNFFADGEMRLVSKHPTTGYRTTNGYPKYTYHVGVEPAYERANVSVSRDSGQSWEAVPSERRFDRTDALQLRIENADGPERIVVPRPGGWNYPLQYDPATVEYEQSGSGLVAEMEDRKYLDPENYLGDRPLDGRKLYLRMFSEQDTGDGPHATVDPFAFAFVLRAENY